MIAFISQFSLSVSMILALLTAVLGFYAVRGIYHHEPALPILKMMQRSVTVTFFLVTLAFVGLIVSFIISDFSVQNVAENSNLSLPIFYRIAASWGSHEGSFLLWVFMFTGWAQAVVWSRFDVSACFKVRVLATLQLILVGFLAYLLIASNPFDYLYPTPLDGRDLNPLLQDIIMIIHPPMLYMGYVGFAVTFAFAIAALLEGRFDITWAKWSRPWTNLAWAFLTLGILLGSWWAYRELGWGGWWFWDPVENASLMPWLSGTALIHSLAVSEKRGALRSWTLLLALTTFALSLLGTFLVRSGVLTSVHAFATDPERGVFILSLLFLVVGVSYMLYALRSGEVGQGGHFQPSGREALLLSNNVFMSVALFMVMLGTLQPLVAEVLFDRKMSVGEPYFNLLFPIILLPAVFIMTLGPFSRWGQTPRSYFMRPGLLAIIVALVGVVLYGLIYQHYGWAWAVSSLSALFLGVGIVINVLQSLFKAGQAKPESGLYWRAKRLGVSYWAMMVAHFGVAVFVIGVTWVKTFELETDAVLKPGEVAEVGPWRVTFVGVDNINGSNYNAYLGVFELTQGSGNTIYLLEPEKRRYFSNEQIMTEAAIHTEWLSDVYISLGEPLQNQTGAWGVRLYYKPLINLIWWGCGLMMLGGLITFFDKRYRRQRKEVRG